MINGRARCAGRSCSPTTADATGSQVLWRDAMRLAESDRLHADDLLLRTRDAGNEAG